MGQERTFQVLRAGDAQNIGSRRVHRAKRSMARLQMRFEYGGAILVAGLSIELPH